MEEIRPCKYFDICDDGALGCILIQDNCKYFISPEDCPDYEPEED
ncbi:hypothetical protein [Haliovirga abyssi]|uniref:Uncharacterized protein n=1 Tax=Haliovirga abyssi TaxID=2996794 RepID=A0AAU9D6M3_9FUSO|nr:hypothetical protein [Haliovirga abyssi]BDU51671.1 hypothetical protein HLVA_22400 [Haliovirga abyssi]